MTASSGTGQWVSTDSVETGHVPILVVGSFLIQSISTRFIYSMKLLFHLVNTRLSITRGSIIMSYSHKKETNEKAAIQRYTQYLNGPGKVVLDNLDEGDSFVMETAQHTIKVTKRLGKAVVQIVPLKPE